jgi:S1-C subfamily serine protease
MKVSDMHRSTQLAAIVLPSFAAGAALAASVLLWAGHGLPSRVSLAESADNRIGAIDRAPRSYADAVSQAAPAVVSIYGSPGGSPGNSANWRNRPNADTPAIYPPIFPPVDPGRQGDTSRVPQPMEHRRGHVSLGSGVLVSRDGLLLTNRHVIIGAAPIHAELADGRVLDVDLLGVDAETDLAVMRARAADLPTITVGDSDALRTGDVVLAIGNPFGLDQTVSLGIVSATGRDDLGLTGIEHFIQTDAAINPGNSGGPLIDADGRLVGINTAILSESGLSEGVGFAIPANMAMRVVQDIATSGSVERGWLGIAGRSLTSQLATRFALRAPYGVLVTRVGVDSPAARAGLRAGDVVSSANGQQLRSSYELLDAVSEAGPDAEVRLQVWRGGQRLDTLAITAERPAGGIKRRMDANNRNRPTPPATPACSPSRHPGGC